MKRIVLIASLAVLSIFANASSSMAANQLTLGVNGGWSYSWGELELEYKMDDVAFGVQAGLGTSVIELGAFGRYYLPLNSYFNIAPEYELSLFAGISPSFLTRLGQTDLGFGFKAGPGIDFRWQHLRIMYELGYGFETLWEIGHHFYTKAGIGYRF